MSKLLTHAFSRALDVAPRRFLPRVSLPDLSALTQMLDWRACA